MTGSVQVSDQTQYRTFSGNRTGNRTKGGDTSILFFHWDEKGEEGGERKGLKDGWTLPDSFF